MNNKPHIFYAFFAFMLLFGCRASNAGSGADDAAIVEHIRESYNLPPQVKLDLGAEEKSDVKGFKRRKVTLSFGGGSKEDSLYISEDGPHYLLGNFRDLSVHPDAARIAKMNLKGSAARGPKDAPVTVVEYTDFQCPFCQQGYEVMTKAIMTEYAGKVRWVYKSLPLVSIHPWAEPAAVAVECAGLESGDKLWAMHDLLFENQKSVTNANFEDKLTEYAKKAGVNMKKFEACYDKKATLERVNSDVQEAGELGATGAPAFLVNGHLIPGADYGLIKRTIDEALEGKHGKI